MRKLIFPLLFTFICITGCKSQSSVYTTALLGETIQRFDPISASEINDITLFSQICGRITSIDEALNIEGDLSDSWTVTSNQKIYVFALRKNRHFVTGEPVTADDVLFSLKRASSDNSVTSTWLNEVVSITKIDDQTIKFQLKEGNPRFLYKLSHPRTCILNRKNPFLTVDGVTVPNSSAPYTVAEIGHKQLTLVATSDFSNLVLERKIRVKFLSQKDAIQQFQAKQINDLSFYLLSSDELKSLPEGTKFLKLPYYWSWAIWLNPLSKQFVTTSARLRTIAHFDTQLFNSLWKTDLNPSRSVIPRGMRGYSENHSPIFTNSSIARGNCFVSVAAIDGMPDQATLNSAIQRVIADSTGCETHVKFLEMGIFVEDYTAGKSDVYVGGIDPNSTDPINFYRRFVSGDSENFLRFNDKKLNEAYEKIVNVPLEQRTRDDYDELQNRFYQSGFGIVLGHPNFQFAYSSDVKSVHMNPLGMHMNRWSKIGRQ